MLALQIEAVAVTFFWFALVAINNSGRPLLWAISGAVIFAVVNVVMSYFFGGIFDTVLAGAVASNGIYFISRMVAILIGFFVCYLALEAWKRRATGASRA